MKSLDKIGLGEVKASWSGTAVQEITKRKGFVFLFVGGLTFLLCLFSFRDGIFQAGFQGEGYVVREVFESDANTYNWSTRDWSTRAEEWRSNREIQKLDLNWAGRQRMYEHRVNGSLWWDEKAAQYFITKLESNQFPANCSQAHWIAHYDWFSGLLSTAHVFMVPLMFSMVRGHPLLPISQPKQPAFDGCGKHLRTRNLQCFFNITSCDFDDDAHRREKILSSTDDNVRTSWEQLLLEGDDFFTPGGVTVVDTFKWTGWDTTVCVGTSPFASYEEAYNYHKLKVWEKMGEAGQVGVLKGYDSTTQTCNGFSQADHAKIVSPWGLNHVGTMPSSLNDKFFWNLIKQ